MDHTTLVHVPEALEDVLGPNHELILLDRLILAKDASGHVIGAISCVLHVQLEVFICLTVVVGADNVGMIHLTMNETLSSGELKSQLRAVYLFLIGRFQHNIILQKLIRFAYFTYLILKTFC